MSNASKSCHVKDSKTGATLRSPNTQITLKVREPIRVKPFVPRKPKRELEETAIARIVSHEKPDPKEIRAARE
jgi:hypothetical protein